MMNLEPRKFKAHLLRGEDKITIEAKYASRFSLLIRFLNGNKAEEGTVYRKLVFQKHGKQVEIGPCKYIHEANGTGYKGRVVFYEDVYDLDSLFFDSKLEKLQSDFINLPLILAHKDNIKKSFKEFTANLTYDLNIYKNLFDALDKKCANEPERIRQQVQMAIIETEGQKFMRFLDEK